jgi:anti-anti-sigma regulatory factor
MSLSDRDGDATSLVVPLDHLRPGTRLVRPLGNLDDGSAAGLLALIDEQLTMTMDVLVLDLTELTRFEPETVRILERIATKLGRMDVGLCLVASEDMVGSALDDAGVRDLFELHSSVDEALEVP